MADFHDDKDGARRLLSLRSVKLSYAANATPAGRRNRPLSVDDIPGPEDRTRPPAGKSTSMQKLSSSVGPRQ